MKLFIKKRVANFSILILGALFTNYAFASTYNINTNGGGGGGFATITALLQDWVDFMTGPYGSAVTVGSIIIGVTIWAVAPKEGILGYAIRGAIAGAVVANIATWMGMFGGGM